MAAGSQSEEETKKWGTHLMGAPAAPTVHPENQQTALWQAQAQGSALHQPYVVYSPVEKPADNPVEYVINVFNSWSHRAEDIARNLWHNLKTGPSVSEAAWGKVNLTAKAITEGGFESLFKQIFTADPNEKLKKTFACYLSTRRGLSPEPSTCQQPESLSAAIVPSLSERLPAKTHGVTTR